MGVNKVVVDTMLIVVPIAAVLFFIYLSWQNVPVNCWEDLNGTKNAILSSLRKCVDKCWSKHDFGAEPVIDDCYVVNLWVKDRTITEKDLENLENVKSYLNYDLLKETKYSVKIRYNYTGNEISFVSVPICGNKIVEKGEQCEGSISTCSDSDYSFGSCTERVCTDKCFCGQLNCNIQECRSGVPTKNNPNTDTDWCRFCKLETEEEGCNDGLDNDCDGKIDTQDSDCVASSNIACKKIADYAKEYATKVVGDGCFWTSPSNVDCRYNVGAPAPNNFVEGSDCAHFASYALKEGGIDIECRYAPSTCRPYGEPGAQRLMNLIINENLGTEVGSVNELTAGDLIFYDWDNNNQIDHVSVYIGSGRVASHTSNGIFNWQMGRSTATFHFIHLKACDSNLQINPDAYNILFVPLHYSVGEFDKFKRDADSVVDYFLQISPFRECPNGRSRINEFLIEPKDCQETCNDMFGDCVNKVLKCAKESQYKNIYDIIVGLCEGNSCPSEGYCGYTSGQVSVTNMGSCYGIPGYRLANHEMGHQFGLGHINCGVDCVRGRPNSDDCAPPQPSADPDDIMGYCNYVKFGNNAYKYLKNVFFKDYIEGC